MSSVIRKKYEVPVPTQEAIEVHIDSLNKGFAEVKTDVRELRADQKALRDRMEERFDTLNTKIDTATTTLNARIDSVNNTLGARIDSVSKELSGKIDSVNNTLSGKIESLGEKVTKMSSDLADMRSLQKAMLWVMGGLGSLAMVLITLGKALHWY